MTLTVQALSSPGSAIQRFAVSGIPVGSVVSASVDNAAIGSFDHSSQVYAGADIVFTFSALEAGTCTARFTCGAQSVSLTVLVDAGPQWVLTVGGRDLSSYVLDGASFREIASSADGQALLSLNGAHAESVVGASVVLSSYGQTLWEGTITSALPQYANGTQTKTLLRASVASASCAVGIAGGSFQNNDIAVLASQIAQSVGVPWGGPDTFGIEVGALNFTQADQALTALATLAGAIWRVENGKLVFVADRNGLTTVDTPLSVYENGAAAVNVLGGPDTQSRIPLATNAQGSGSGPTVYVAQPEIADSATLARYAWVMASRYGAGAVYGSGAFQPWVRAGDWVIDASGVTAIAFDVHYAIVNGALQLTAQVGFPPLPMNPQYSAAFADAMHRLPVARLHTDYVVSGCDLSVSGLTVSVAAGTVNIGGTAYSLSGRSFTLEENETATVIATPTGFTMVSGTNPPIPGTGVLLHIVTASNTTVLQQNDVRPHGGVGNSNLKPANPNNAPVITLGSLGLQAEGATSAKAAIPFTISGLTLDDTIGSIEVVQSFAGENEWGNAHVLAWSPGTTSFMDYRHGLSAAQSYDLAVNILGRDGKPLNASPLLIGISPTISSTAIGIALNLDEVPDGPSGHRNAVSAIDSNHRALIDPTQTGHVGGALTDNSGAALHSRMSAAYQGNFSSAGAMLSSKLFNSTVPNSSSFFLDFYWEWVYTYDSVANAYDFNIWYDNGTAGDDCFIYVPNYTSTPGDRDINLGHSTSSSPSISGFVVPSGSSLYLLAYYTPGSGMTTQAQTVPFTPAQMRTAVQDGGYVCAFATVGTGSVFKPTGTTGGSGGHAGNGGHVLPNMN